MKAVPPPERDAQIVPEASADEAEPADQVSRGQVSAEPVPEGFVAHEHEGHHVLRDPEDGDRWAWRCRIRANPVWLFWYRIGVAVAGLLVMVLAVVLGPLPGPGGIPLFLAGLAIWASEFAWAAHLMHWFRRMFSRFRVATGTQKVLSVAGIIVVIWLLGYASLVVFGPPGWLPDWAERLAHRLPGV